MQYKLASKMRIFLFAGVWTGIFNDNTFKDTYIKEKSIINNLFHYYANLIVVVLFELHVIVTYISITSARTVFVNYISSYFPLFLFINMKAKSVVQDYKLFASTTAFFFLWPQLISSF